jgi:hypothetical protein
MSDEFDRYIGNCIKNWAAGQAPPSNRRQKLLGMAASAGHPFYRPFSRPVNDNVMIPREFFASSINDAGKQSPLLWGFHMTLPVIRMIFG